MITKVHAKRLLKLADFLETIPRRFFNMRNWGYSNNGAKIGECGTSACAAGWACQMKPFKDLGMKLVKSSYDEGYYDILVTPNKKNKGSACLSYIFGSGEDLFLSYLGSTPKQKAKEIRKYVFERYPELR